MEKRFISTSTHILDPANPSTPPIRQSPPPPPGKDSFDPLVPDPNDKRSLFEKLEEKKAKKQEAFEEAYKFSESPDSLYPLFLRHILLKLFVSVLY
jgi:hypothetical protein